MNQKQSEVLNNWINLNEKKQSDLYKFKDNLIQMEDQKQNQEGFLHLPSSASKSKRKSLQRSATFKNPAQDQQTQSIAQSQASGAGEERKQPTGLKKSDSYLNSQDLMNIQFLRSQVSSQPVKPNPAFKAPKRAESSLKKIMKESFFAADLNQKRSDLQLPSEPPEPFVIDKQFIFQCEQDLSSKLNIPTSVDPETYEQLAPTTQIEALLWIFDKLFNSPYGVRPKDLQLLKNYFGLKQHPTATGQASARDGSSTLNFGSDSQQQQNRGMSLFAPKDSVVIETEREQQREGSLSIHTNQASQGLLKQERDQPSQGQLQFEAIQAVVNKVASFKDNSKKMISTLKTAKLEMDKLRANAAPSVGSMNPANKPTSPLSGLAAGIASSFQSRLSMARINVGVVDQAKKEEQFKQQLANKDKELEEFKQKFEVMKQAMKQLEIKSNENSGIVQLELPQSAEDIDYAQKISDQNQEFEKVHRLTGGLLLQTFQTLRGIPQELLDELQREALITSIQNQFEKMRQVQDIFLDENSALYEKKADLQSRIETMHKNTKYLEGRLASILTEKEEQIIKLKSEMLIYKNKINAYKAKLKESVTGYETKKLKQMQEKQEQEASSKDAQIIELTSRLEDLTTTNAQLQETVETLLNQQESSAQSHQAQVDELNLIITQLSTRLKEIDQDYNQQLSKVDNIRDITQKRLNIEQKERTLNSLKLEYLINNYKKLEMQKRFLQRTLEKDMLNLTQEMRKTELEIQREVYMTSQSAQTRLSNMYTIIKESLRYVKEVIGFMNFEVDRVREDNFDYQQLENDIKQGQFALTQMLNVKSSDILDPPSATMRLQGKGPVGVGGDSGGLAMLLGAGGQVVNTDSQSQLQHEDPLQKYDRLKKEESAIFQQQQQMSPDQESQVDFALMQEQPTPLSQTLLMQSSVKPSRMYITSIDQCYYKYIHELCEVLLSVLSEIYKDSKSQNSMEMVQLFDLLQSKTDKKIVQEIYSKYFAPTRIHFAQFQSRQQEKLFDLQQERQDLKVQLHRLNNQINEMYAEQEREQQEELRQLQKQQEQEQMQLQDLGIIEEEFKDSGSNVGRGTTTGYLMHQNSDALVLTGGGNVATTVGGGGLNSPLGGNFKFFASNAMSGGPGTQAMGVPATGNGSQTRSSRQSVEIPKNSSIIMQMQRHSTMNEHPQNIDQSSTTMNPLTRLSMQQQTSAMGNSQQQPSQQSPSGNPLRDLLFHAQRHQQSNSVPASAGSRPASNNPLGGAVASVLFKSSEKRIVEMLNAENQALKERVRETRLMFQKQINELNDAIRLLKDQHFAEINRIKIEYGRDLGVLHKQQKQKEVEMQQEMSNMHKDRIDELIKEHQETIKRVKKEDNERMEELRARLEKTELLKLELDREIKKLKKQSNLVAQGGWGTFAIALETAPKKMNNLIASSNTFVGGFGSLNSPQKSTVDTSFKDFGMGVANSNNNASQSSSYNRKLSSQSSNENNLLNEDFHLRDPFEKEELPLKQLNHFIEVGFLLDQKNFNFIDLYREKTFDSQLTKYLFEFQDPVSNHQMLSLQNKIKQQLVENFALFNEINPVYVTLNLGRTISPFYGDDSLSMDHFKLIKREGIELNGGAYQLMVNFLKCDEPQLVMRVIAFDSEKQLQHSFDLVFEDLMLLVDGNMKLFEEDHLGDLCQLILNNLTMIKRGGQSGSLLGAANKRKARTTTTGRGFKMHETSLEERIENFDEPNGGQIEGEGEGGQDADLDGGSSVAGSIQNRRARTNTKDNLALQSHNTVATPLTIGLSDRWTLAVEHRLFFNDTFKLDYDKNNRVILGKHDKKKKGLVQEKQMATDFEKSVIYEAFETVYSETLLLQVKECQKSVRLDMKRGKMSHHMVLSVSDPISSYSQDLMLYFSTEYQKCHQTQQVVSEIVKFPQDERLNGVVEDNDDADVGSSPPLALVVSYEKYYGIDHFVIRLVLVGKYDSKSMTKYDWRPNQSSLQFGSVSFQQETLYLVRQANSHYLRMSHYEILNTELRSMLFMYSYGYEQSLIDFGKLKAIEGVNIKVPLEKKQYSTMNLIFREFGVIRLKVFTPKKSNQHRDSQMEIADFSPEKQQDRRNNKSPNRAESDFSEESDEEAEGYSVNVENQFCVYSFYDDLACLSQSEIHIHLRVHGAQGGQSVQSQKSITQMTQIVTTNSGQLEITQKLAVGEIVSAKDLEGMSSNVGTQESLCKQIFDKLILQFKDGVYELLVDKAVEPMSEVIDEIKRKKYLVKNDTEDLMDTELDPKNVSISLNQLAECPKLTQVSIINRKVFKVTSYFLKNIKNLKLAVPPTHSSNSSSSSSQKKTFDWQVLYLDCYQRMKAKSHIILITEWDLYEIYSKLKAKLSQSGGDQSNLLAIYEESDILNAKVKKEKLIDFILDCLVFNEQKNQIQLSISHLRSRLEDRVRLEQYFKLSGSRFVNKSGQIEDPDHLIYKTSLPQIEVTRKLLLNIEKDFSDKRYDLKLYELSLKSTNKSVFTNQIATQSGSQESSQQVSSSTPFTAAQNSNTHKKYVIEMFCVEQPAAIFRAEFYSQAHSTGKKLLIERFNVIQQMHLDYEESKFMRDGMVLAIVEQSFPHSIVFMILEPASHIQWQHVLSTDKLNQIENRVDKEFLIAQAKDTLERSLMCGVDKEEDIVHIQQLGYQKTAIQQGKIDLWQGNLKSALNDHNNLLYAKNFEVKLLSNNQQNEQTVFLEFSVLADRLFNSISLQFTNQINKEVITTSVLVDTRRESSRVFLGYLVFPHFGNLKLLYIVENCQAYTQQERALRIKIKEPQLAQDLCDVILAEKHIVTTKQNQDGKSFICLKDELKFAFNTGFKDSYSLFQKLPDVMTDFISAFLPAPERLTYAKPVDTSKMLYRKVYRLSAVTGAPLKPQLNQTGQAARTNSQMSKDAGNNSSKNAQASQNPNSSDEQNSNQQGNQSHSLIVQVKYESIELAEIEWVVVIFDQRTDYQESFTFKLETILTKDEINTLNAKNDRIMKDVVQRVVDKRMRIKMLDEKYDVVKSTPPHTHLDTFYKMFDSSSLKKTPSKRYFVYFIDPPLGVASDQKQFSAMHNFDIRHGFRFSLTNSESVVPEVVDKQTQERLIVYIEKDDLLFDISEILNPYELILRIKTYQKDTLKMISMSDIKEYDIRKELLKDQRSFLIEPQRREELAKYLVQNTYYDELRQRVFFLKTTVITSPTLKEPTSASRQTKTKDAQV